MGLEGAKRSVGRARVWFKTLEAPPQVVQHPRLVQVPQRSHVGLERRVASEQLATLRLVDRDRAAVARADQELGLPHLLLHSPW
jgi:hypothetical protein